jgi:hypothetical protein
LIQASPVVKIAEPTTPSTARNTNQAAMLSNTFIARNNAMSRPKQTNMKSRMPNRCTRRDASSGPMITPMNVAPAFSPFSVTLVPRCSSSSGSNGPA